MMIFRVEHGIPVPSEQLRRARHTGNNTRAKYPWDIMNVGDSFLVPESELPLNRQSALRGTAAHQARSRGTKYVIRSVVGGFRVWRVA